MLGGKGKFLHFLKVISICHFTTRGFVPARRDPFVLAKGPKTISARARPYGFLRHRTESRWLRNSLRSNSPRPDFRIRLSIVQSVPPVPLPCSPPFDLQLCRKGGLTFKGSTIVSYCSFWSWVQLQLALLAVQRQACR